MADLVIFDCDGVLVDSELLSARIEIAELARVGIELSLEDCLERFVGISSTSMYRMIETEAARPLPDGFAERVHARTLELFARELRPIEGIAEALDALDGPRCVASSSAPERIRRSLAVTGLIGRLEPHVFSATMVASGKPAPDLFLLASTRMGVPPESCVVVEDSIAGVRAGKAAGMTVLGFTGGGHCRPGHDRRLREAGADQVLDDMRALPELVRGGR
jgi:HAD superfamily hydrolase (TIGR01509 family)